MAAALAAIAFFSNVHNVGDDIFLHLDKGAPGWMAYVVAMAFGAALVLAACALSLARFKGPNPRPTGAQLDCSASLTTGSTRDDESVARRVSSSTTATTLKCRSVHAMREAKSDPKPASVRPTEVVL